MQARLPAAVDLPPTLLFDYPSMDAICSLHCQPGERPAVTGVAMAIVTIAAHRLRRQRSSVSQVLLFSCLAA